MFKGRYLHTLDAKGRLSIPSRFREVLSRHREEVLILTNFDSCLVGQACHGPRQRQVPFQGLGLHQSQRTAFLLLMPFLLPA